MRRVITALAVVAFCTVAVAGENEKDQRKEKDQKNDPHKAEFKRNINGRPKSSKRGISSNQNSIGDLLG